MGNRIGRGPLLALTLAGAVLGPSRALAQGGDLTFFGGYAYPTYSQQFVFDAPSVPSLPGLEVRPEGDLVLDAKGGPVFGAAAAFELGGFFAIEGRFDSTAIELDSSGARYAVSGGILSGAITIGQGPIPVDRLNLLSLNLRLRTPGAVSFVASGGFSYLPKFAVGGSIPLRVEIAGSVIPDIEVPLRLAIAPTDSEHRFGVNGGVGLRVKVAAHASIVGEIRGFYFKQYELVAESDDPLLSGLLASFQAVRFDPIIVNGVAGVSFSF